MTPTEKYNLWQNTELSKIDSNITLVRNNLSGGLMIQTLLPSENFNIMKTLSGIAHPNLMRVYDTMVTGNKCVSLCEYVEGNTLEFFVENYNPYSEQQVKIIICQICDGLTVLHKNNIIHRDINPSNVMIDKNGIVKIIDFDIVRTVKNNQSKDTRILGTAGYASPEQFGFHQTGFTADIYSCGVLMNYLLTGKLPDENLYKGNLSPIINKCMEIDDKNRYQSAEMLKEELLGTNNNYAKKQNTKSNQPNVNTNIYQDDRSGLFDKLPGFRSNKTYKKVIACICYGYYFLFLLSYIMGVATGSLNEKSSNIFYALGIFLFWSLLPFLSFFDVGNISRFLPGKSPKFKKNLLTIIGIVSIVIGFILIYIGSNTMPK
ncbi:MAG: serine/threonine-protein kinase [Ruminococcus sp.]